MLHLHRHDHLINLINFILQIVLESGIAEQIRLTELILNDVSLDRFHSYGQMQIFGLENNNKIITSNLFCSWHCDVLAL